MNNQPTTKFNVNDRVVYTNSEQKVFYAYIKGVNDDGTYFLHADLDKATDDQLEINTHSNFTLPNTDMNYESIHMDYIINDYTEYFKNQLSEQKIVVERSGNQIIFTLLPTKPELLEKATLDEIKLKLNDVIDNLTKTSYKYFNDNIYMFFRYPSVIPVPLNSLLI